MNIASTLSPETGFCWCCSRSVSAWISSCMAVTEATATGAGARMTGTSHDRHRARLWPLVPGDRQLGDFHPVRLQLFQTQDPTRLAFLRRLRGLSGGLVHRDVRLSTDPLFPLRLAAEPLSRSELAVP